MLHFKQSSSDVVLKDISIWFLLSFSANITEEQMYGRTSHCRDSMKNYILSLAKRFMRGGDQFKLPNPALNWSHLSTCNFGELKDV